MNLFGIVIGQNVLYVVFGFIFLAIANALMQRGWVGRVFGIALFAGAVGWISSIVLYENARVPELGLPAAYVFTLLAACYAAFTVYQHRDNEVRSLFAGRGVSMNKNSVIAGGILALIVIVTLSVLGQGSWESFFDFDSRAASRAREETTNGILRFINRSLLAPIDRFLAR